MTNSLPYIASFAVSGSSVLAQAQPSGMLEGWAQIGSELWLTGTLTSIAGVPNYGAMVSEINTKIQELDALENISTGYTVTEGDLSSYTDYT